MYIYTYIYGIFFSKRRTEIRNVLSTQMMRKSSDESELFATFCSWQNQEIHLTPQAMEGGGGALCTPSPPPLPFFALYSKYL